MQVLVVSPPNSNTVIDGASCTVTRPEEHTDWSDFPNLGVLTLVSALRDIPGVEPIYVDGTVVPWSDVLRYVEENAGDFLALCISALTATYEAGLHLCAAAKNANSRIVTILGNDHVTALTRECMSSRAGVIDYAFVVPAHLHSPKYVYSHRWQTGDLLVIDNQRTLHGRTAIGSDGVRLLLRGQVTLASAN